MNTVIDIEIKGEFSELEEMLKNRIINLKRNKKKEITKFFNKISFLRRYSKDFFEKDLYLEKIVEEYYIKLEHNKNKTSYIYIAEIFEK